MLPWKIMLSTCSIPAHGGTARCDATRGRRDRWRPSLHAHFYRFLDAQGGVMIPPNDSGLGDSDYEGKMLARAVPQTMEIGYLTRDEERAARSVQEIVAMPIRSTETDEVIGALVLGFEPVESRRIGNQPACRRDSG